MRNYAAPLAFTAAFLAVFSMAVTPPAEARRAFARGANGSLGAFAHQGQYGQRAGARALGANQGFGFRGGSYQGPNGSTLQTAQGGAYKKGVGAFRAKQFQATGANGGNASRYMNNAYNAQTGTGTRNSGASYTNPQGQSYGYDGTTNYAKGQGATTTIDTQNKGDYTIDWQKGQKPVVTPTSTTIE
ncbi:MAG: hypothetical protein DKT66_26925 [Candidatus Melainabacteria bacterium]|nr:MAG: hypothetical protein DKT66_26925 [Candidatus Melainabacteria bacterium]